MSGFVSDSTTAAPQVDERPRPRLDPSEAADAAAVAALVFVSTAVGRLLAFGIFFQMPVALTLMGHAGIVSAEGLAKKRKYAIVIMFGVAAILTPPDIISQIGLALPGLLLYEISIQLVKRVERKREAAWDPAADDA